jgi:hypothetical protein
MLMGVFGIIGIALEMLRLAREGDGVASPKPKGNEDGEKFQLSELLIVLVALTIFIAVTDWFGMEAGVFSFVAALVYYVTRRAFIAVIAGISAVLVVYFVFVQGLSVAMPLTFLPRYLAW